MAQVAVFAIFTSLAIYCVFVYAVFFRHFDPAARKVFIALTAIELVLLILSLQSELKSTGFIKFQIYLGNEKNLGATFSATQIMLLALVALYNGIFTQHKNKWLRLYWLFSSAVFLLMAIDEYFMLHDNHVWGLNWNLFYLALGGIMVLLTTGMGWLVRADRRLLWLFGAIFIGYGIVGGGGSILDLAIKNTALNELPYEIRTLSHSLEDILEMAGFTLIMAVGVTVGRGYSNPQHWRRAVPVFAGVSLIWLVGIVVWQWFVPAWEVQNRAVQASVIFGDGDMELLGYRFDREVYAPGDPVNVMTYWRTNAPIITDHGLSGHLLDLPDLNSRAREEHIIDLPRTRNWPVNVVIRVPYDDLVIPEDFTTPGSLRLMISVWPWEGKTQTEFTFEEIVSSTLPQLSDIAVFAGSIPVIGEPPTTAPTTETAITFANGLQLTGYTLPEALSGEAADFAYWWETDDALTQDLTQFLHIFHSNGEDVYVFDRQPFDGRFPTYDWPGGIAVMDEQTIPLPEDMPAGECAVYTGWYDATTQERLSAVGADGQPVQDSTVYLGEVPCGE